MKATDFVRQVKDTLTIDGEVKTKMPIKVILKSYIGYNYDKKEHEYTDREFKITSVYRTGKKGVVYLSDEFNKFSPKEFKEEDLDAIFMNLKFIVKIPFVKTWCDYLTPCPYRNKEKKQDGIMVGDYFCSNCLCQKEYHDKKDETNPDDERYVICDISKLVI